MMATRWDDEPSPADHAGKNVVWEISRRQVRPEASNPPLRSICDEAKDPLYGVTQSRNDENREHVIPAASVPEAKHNCLQSRSFMSSSR